MSVYYIYSALFLIWAAGSIPYPKLIITKNLEKEFGKRDEEKRKYLVHQRVNLFLLATVLFLSAFVPAHMREHVCLIGMLLIFISVLWCNRLYLGRLTAYCKHINK